MTEGLPQVMQRRAGTDKWSYESFDNINIQDTDIFTVLSYTVVSFVVDKHFKTMECSIKWDYIQSVIIDKSM